MGPGQGWTDADGNLKNVSCLTGLWSYFKVNEKFHSGLKLKRNRGPNSGQPRLTVTGTAKVELGLPDATIISNHFHSRIGIKNVSIQKLEKFSRNCVLEFCFKIFETL